MRLIDADVLVFKCKQISTLGWNERVAPASWADAYKDFIEDIDDAPTIDAEPAKHGRWVYKNDYIGNTYYCSECGRAVYLDKYEEPNLTYYCPCCGAKMDGGDDDD